MGFLSEGGQSDLRQAGYWKSTNFRFFSFLLHERVTLGSQAEAAVELEAGSWGFMTDLRTSLRDLQTKAGWGVYRGLC